MLNNFSTQGGMKLRGRIVTVDPATRRVEAVLKDYGLVQVAVYDIPAQFRWPKEGETWTLLRDGMNWTLGTPEESEDSSLSVVDLEPGDTMIGTDGAKVHIKGELVASIADPRGPENEEGSLYFSQGRRITFRHTLGRYSIDALNGDMRFFTENSDGTGGLVRALLTRTGEFQLPFATSATASVVLGGDVRLYRGAADELHLAAGDRIVFDSSFSSYTTDGLWSANARPSIMYTPNGRTGATASQLRFGYVDYGSGQYHPALGFQMAGATFPTNLGIIQMRKSGEANNLFEIRGDGSMWWGVGGNTAVDLRLYRGPTGGLTTNGRFDIPSSAVAIRAGESFAKVNQQEFLQAWNATDGQDWSLYRPGGTRNFVFYNGEIGANLLTLASTGITVRGGITLGEGWAGGSTVTPKYFEFPGTVSGTMKRRWLKNTTSEAIHRRLSLFHFSRDTANWMLSAGYYITIRNGYPDGGSITRSFVGGAYGTPAFVHVISSHGPVPIVPKLAAAVTISGSVVRNEVYVEMPAYHLVSVEVEYGGAVNEVTSTPTGFPQVQFTGTETALGSDPGFYTGYFDVQYGINFRTGAQASSDTNLYRGGVASLYTDVTQLRFTANAARMTFMSASNRYNIDALNGNLRFFRENTDGTNGAVRLSLSDDGTAVFSGTDVSHTGTGFMYTSGGGLRTNNSQGNLHLDAKTPSGGNGNIYLNWSAAGDVIWANGANVERGRLTNAGDLKFNTLRGGLIGVYDPANTQAIWAMGDAYKLNKNNASNDYGNFYGLAYSYDPGYGGLGNNPQSKSGLLHQLLVMMHGETYTAIGNGVWTRGNLTANRVTASSSDGIHGPTGQMMTGYDSWLRVNQNSSFTSGLYIPGRGVDITGALRVNSSIEIGGAGSGGVGSQIVDGSRNFFGQSYRINTDQADGTVLVHYGPSFAYTYKTGWQLALIDYPGSGANSRYLAGDYIKWSDRSLKEDIEPVADPVDKLMAVSGHRHAWKGPKEIEVEEPVTDKNGKPVMVGKGDKQRPKTVKKMLPANQPTFGFIADEVKPVMPELVGYDAVQDIETLAYMGMLPVLWEASKKMVTTIRQLREQINEQEARLQALEARLPPVA